MQNKKLNNLIKIYKNSIFCCIQKT